MFSIIISEKGGGERRQTFNQRDVSIGRVQGNDLVLPKGNVSKRHCRVEWSTDGRFLVSDQNSTNGTYLNRRRISQSTVVRQGDRIYLGDYVLRIEEGIGADDGLEGEAGQQPPAAMIQPGASVAPGPRVPLPTEVEPTPAAAEHSGSPLGQTTGQMPAGPVMAPRPDEAPRVSPLEPRSLRGDAPRPEPRIEPPRIEPPRIEPPRGDASRIDPDDIPQNLVAMVRFIVDRVSTLLGRIELDGAQSAVRVDPALEQVLFELQREGLTDAPTAATLKRAARAELVEVGPFAALLEDPSVSEISASGTGFLSVLRGAERRAGLPFCAPGSLERALERLCAHDGVPLHQSEQLGQRFLPSWSFNLEFVRGPTTPEGPIVRLRRRDPIAVSLDDLVRGGTVSRHLATFLQQCIAGRANILVVGGQRTGAQEVLSALALASEGERVLMLTDFEIAAGPEGRTMALQESPGVRLDQVLSKLADLGGHRLVIDGLSQGGRALGTLRALFEGADGVVARLASRSIERGIAQLCSQVALSTPGLSVGAVADGIVAAFDVALEVGRLRDGRSRVLRVAELGRGQDGSVIANDVFTFVVDRIASGGAVEGSFNPTGRRPHFALALKARGVRLDSGMFGRAARTTSPDEPR